jgi:hypothetical protein
MASHAWVLGVRPGYEEEYKKRHDELWPEMDACLRAAGIRNYHIFRHGLTLFGYFETDDLSRTIADPQGRPGEPAVVAAHGRHHGRGRSTAAPASPSSSPAVEPRCDA